MRRRGMGILFDAFEYMFAGGCLLVMNFLLMLLFGILRNLPAIFSAARQTLREILILTYRLYKPLIIRLEPAAQRYLGIQIGRSPMRLGAAAIISLMILLLVDLLLSWPVSLFLSVMAIAHGALVGFLWDDLEQADGLRTGERIE